MVVVAVSLTAAADEPEFPRGTFTASVQKSWSLKFEEKEKLTVMSVGKVLVEGTYKVTKDEVTLTDVSGPFAAKEKELKSGTYKWKVENGKLKFTLVKDKSKGRELLLTTNEWEEKK
jgi:hypothetical protein